MADHVTRSKSLARARRKVQERLKAMKHKPVKMWAVVGDNGRFTSDDVHGTRNAARDDRAWRVCGFLYEVVPVSVQRLK